MKKSNFKFKKGLNKTEFKSYCLDGISEGCKRCIEGKKLVLFITGKCSTNCAYCPLSHLRKNSENIWANETKCTSIKEVIKEAEESNATGAGITGGDPLLVLNKTLRYAKALKQKFGNSFHIHIYLSTKLVDEQKLKKLSKCIDEVRFHPFYLENPEKHPEDIEKISKAKDYFNKKSIGVEIPIFPDKEKETIQFLKKVSPFVSFVNLNELEMGESNLGHITKNYSLDKSGYTIKNSIKSGLKIIKALEKNKPKLKIHLCTAETKNWYQYKNRLLQHKILPYGKLIEDGTVIYVSILKEKNAGFDRLRKSIPKSEAYYDKEKNRLILNEKYIRKYLPNFTITKTEEFPTSDRIEVVAEDIN